MDNQSRQNTADDEDIRVLAEEFEKLRKKFIDRRTRSRHPWCFECLGKWLGRKGR